MARSDDTIRLLNKIEDILHPVWLSVDDHDFNLELPFSDTLATKLYYLYDDISNLRKEYERKR